MEHSLTILDSISEGVFTIELDSTITFFNRAAENITGYRKSDVIGRKCHEIMKMHICNGHCMVQEALKTGGAIHRESEIIARDMRKIPVAINASLLREEGEKVTGAVVTFRDLSLIFDLKKEIRSKHSFHDMVSRSDMMRKIFDIVPDIAATEATVLIQGESGTGKELFARAIHELSPRSNGPLLVVNCGALPEPLLEAEIFGARKGAYTGAVENRLGRMDLAQGGSLFLDEIGDLPLPLQVKLLRVLENREYQPLGAQKVQKANVRFIAATNCDLEEMVAKGTFRRDLFFRINVVRIEIPPLREHKEDIPVLMDYALARFNEKYSKKIMGFSPDVVQVMIEHDFPGNVRELLNLVEQAVIFCKTEEIGIQNLPPSFLATRRPHKAHKQTRHCPPKDVLAQLLARNNGNRGQLAEELGVDRSTLWRWMKKHHIGDDWGNTGGN